MVYIYQDRTKLIQKKIGLNLKVSLETCFPHLLMSRTLGKMAVKPWLPITEMAASYVTAFNQDGGEPMAWPSLSQSQDGNQSQSVCPVCSCQWGGWFKMSKLVVHYHFLPSKLLVVLPLPPGPHKDKLEVGMGRGGGRAYVAPGALSSLRWREGGRAQLPKKLDIASADQFE